MRDGLGRVQRVLVLGGGSEIAQATLAALLEQGPLTAILAVRRPDELDTATLEARGATIERISFDARETTAHGAAFDAAFAGGDVDLVLVAFGVLGNQERDEHNAGSAVALAQTNFVGAISALIHATERLLAQGHGTMVVLSSIAGQRSRRSNYVYGATKAGIDAFAQGVQLALADEDIHVVIVRPGFVHTKMTAGLKPAPFSVSASEVAAAIVEGVRNRTAVVWVPGKLRWVAAVLRLLPASLLRRA